MSQYTDIQSKQQRGAASSLPAFSPHIKVVCVMTLSSCFLQRTSVIGPTVFWAPCLHWIQCITLQSPSVSDHEQVTETLEACEMGWLHWRQLWMFPTRVMGPLGLFSVLQKTQQKPHIYPQYDGTV